MTAEIEVTLFLLIATCLGACFVWALWEIERGREHRSQIKRIRAWQQIG
jgi:hypothetical protein